VSAGPSGVIKERRHDRGPAYLPQAGGARI
jgi:hypothetical protein